MEFRSYDSADEMMADMTRMEDIANQGLTPAQLEVARGDYWISYHPNIDLWIFGQSMTREQAYAGSIAAGASPEEAEYEQKDLDEAYERGYIFGRAHSVACPDGELGDTHRASMLGKLSEIEFRLAQDRLWDIDEIFDASPSLRAKIRGYVSQKPAAPPQAPDLGI